MKKILLLLAISVGVISCKKEKTKDKEPESSTLFTRATEPVFESPLGLAADPSVVKSGDTLYLYYTAENQTIGVSISLDNGATWNSPDGNNHQDYAALVGQANGWDNTLETVDVLKVGSEYWMFYSGYREGEGDNPHVENYEIGLAISSNGLDFVRHPQSLNQPLLARDTSSTKTYDRHAMTSPGVVYNGGNFYMIYAGWNVENDWTGTHAGIRILGATSTDGIMWSKISEPIIQPSQITYNPDVNEASLIKSPEGYWYIPFSTGNDIGIARSTSFLGPYEIYPEPIVVPQFSWDSEVTAPDGILENNKMRLWYHGVKAPLYWPWVIGYSEAKYPLEWK